MVSQLISVQKRRRSRPPDYPRAPVPTVTRLTVLGEDNKLPAIAVGAHTSGMLTPARRRGEDPLVREPGRHSLRDVSRGAVMPERSA
jgi:hypothetical protein